MSTARDKLIAEIDSFLSREGMAPSTFGRLAMGDPAFVGRLRDGQTVRLDTADKLRAFMAANKRARRGRDQRCSA